MSDELRTLIENARLRRMSSEDRAKQRISFAYGNGAEEGAIVSRHSLREADKIIRSQTGPKQK